MSADYDQHTDDSVKTAGKEVTLGNGPDEAAMEDAAEALRHAEVEAVQTDVPEPAGLTPSKLDEMNIDELRDVARQLDVPDRGTIIDRDELIGAIRQCMP
jgi:hypothetical protein